jgi:hypothetical protein
VAEPVPQEQVHQAGGHDEDRQCRAERARVLLDGEPDQTRNGRAAQCGRPGLEADDLVGGLGRGAFGRGQDQQRIDRGAGQPEAHHGNQGRDRARGVDQHGGDDEQHGGDRQHPPRPDALGELAETDPPDDEQEPVAGRERAGDDGVDPDMLGEERERPQRDRHLDAVLDDDGCHSRHRVDRPHPDGRTLGPGRTAGHGGGAPVLPGEGEHDAGDREDPGHDQIRRSPACSGGDGGGRDQWRERGADAVAGVQHGDPSRTEPASCVGVEAGVDGTAGEPQHGDRREELPPRGAERVGGQPDGGEQRAGGEDAADTEAAGEAGGQAGGDQPGGGADRGDQPGGAERHAEGQLDRGPRHPEHGR